MSSDPHFNVATGNDYHHRLRMKTVAHLGGCCVQCGFSDWRALQIDHVNGDGLNDRKKYTNGGSSSMFLKAVLKDKEGKYQLLCANCNWIKRWDKRESTGKPSWTERVDAEIRAKIAAK